MSNFKKILIIILLTIPFLIGTGLSAWVIINVHENESPPDYNYEAIINNAFNNQQKPYTGNELGPDAMYGGEINTTIIDSKSFTFEYFDGEKWVEGLPTDSGKYNVRVINKYDSNASGIIITFEINKADQRISVENLVVTYDGEEHFIEEDSITIVFGNEEDGSITITGNEPRTNVGTTVVTITVAGNSNFNDYSASVNIEVEPKPISDADVSVTVVPSYTFDNTEKRPGYSDLEIKYNGMTLTTNDYKITGYANNVDATSDVLATVTIEGINNYSGTRVISFEIAKANQNPSFDISKTYDGNELVIDVTKDELVTSSPVIKYFDELKNEISAPTNAGTYFIQVTIEGNNNYNNYDSGFVEYIINPRTVNDLTINAVDDIKYTASAITLPKPTVLYGDVTLVENTDYTLKYFNENGDEVTEIIDAGKYTIKVIGTGNFEGEKTLTFKVVKNAISAGSFTIESKVYTGSALEPVVTIVYDGNTLVKDADFTVDFDEMIDADTYNITINGIGLYEGTVNKDFVIEPADINNVTVYGIDSLVYTGKNITISPIITYNDIVIDNGNYSYNVYQNSIETTIKDAGAYLLKLTGSKNFINFKEVEINVAKLDVSNVEFVAGSVTYNATDQAPAVVATYDGLELDASNFSVTSSTTEFINANTYELLISGNTNLTGTTTCEYLINKLEISNVTALYNTSEYYTNSSIKPEINLTYKEITLEENTDFTVSYGENIEVGVGAGSIIVTATESSNFKGTHTYYFDIVMQSVESATITGYNSTISYTGTKYMPDVTVMIGDVTLRKDVDYTVEYGENVDAGTQTYILVKGIGIYEGEQNIVVNIVKANITGISFQDKTVTYSGNNNTLEITGTLPTDVSVEYYYTSDLTTKFTGEVEVGSYGVTAVFTVNNPNYNDLDNMTATLQVEKATFNMDGISFDDLVTVYNGIAHTIKLTGTLPADLGVEYYIGEDEFTSATLAGSYQIIAKFVDLSDGGNNYQLPADMTATLVIEKTQPIITISNATYKVDYLAELGLANNYIITVNPDNLAPVVTIVDALGNDVTNESTLVVGTYTVTISIEGNNNTKAATNSFTLEVEKIDPVYPALPEELYGIYGNTLSTVSGLPTGWVFTNPDTVMSTTGEMVADVKFVPTDPDNYNVVNTTIKVVVEKATISGITFESDSFEYDGTNKMIAITGTLPTGITVKYYVDDVEFTGAVNAGEYTIKAVFTDTTGNYNDIAPMIATLTITKIDAVIDGVTFLDKEVNYSGNNNTIILTGTLPDYLDVVYYYYGTNNEFNGEVNAGIYKVTAKFVDISGGENYNLPSDLHATLTINQIMDPSYVEQTALTANFGNTLNDIKTQLLTGWSFVDDLSTSVGNGGTRTVKVTYTPTDTTNYLTVTKDIEITVNAIDPSFTVTDNSHVFDNTAKDVTVTTNSDGIVSIIYKLNNEVVTNPTNAGTYDIYVSISGTTNYNAVTEKLADVKLVISAYNITSENTTLSGIVNKEYTGSEVTQDVVVTSTVFGKLTEGVDYDVTYVNNIDLGTATVKVTMKGNYSGTLTQDFEITTGSINDASITPIEDVVYSGKEAVYSLVVTVNGKVLTLNIDYTVEITGDTVNVGTVTITVTGKGNYGGTGTTTFDIVKANIENAIDFEIADQTYLEGGNTPLPEIEIIGIGTLIKDTDYKVTYTNNNNVGTATMTVQGINNFEGEIVKTFNIVQKSIEDATVSYENEFVYSGNEYKPSVTLTLDGYTTVTYNVTYKNNKDAGTATITVTATGNFTGSKELEFTINKFDLKDLLDSQISMTGDFTYKASQITPSVSVSFNDSTLDAANYTVTYGTNLTVKDGGTVTITANNNTNFTGSKVVKFNITPMSIKDADVTFATEYYKNGAITPTPTVKVNGFDTLVQGVDYTISHDEIFNAGEYTITITGCGNFTGTISKTLDVLPVSIEDAVIGEILDQNYTSHEITPKPIIVVQGKYTLVENQDYTLTYEDNVNVGVATITITAKGNFTGTITKQFNIVDTIASSTVYFGDSTTVGPFTYNNTAHKPTVTKVVINGVTLVEGVNYTVEYAENINAGTGHIYIVAVEGGGYIGSKDIEFIIEKADQTISVENINITYDGKSHMVSATSSIGGAITYTLNGNAFIGATNAGEYVVTIHAAGNSNYNEATTEATINIAKFDIKNFVIGENIIDFDDSHVYTGSAITPLINLVFNGKEIDDNITLSYSNNIEPTNNATITISAISATNFTGSKTLTYEITKVPQTITASDVTVEYNKDYTVTYNKLGDGQVTITYKDLNGNTIEKPTEVGTYKAIISVAEGTYHLSGTKEITITITPISSTLQVTKDSFVYNGQPVAIEYTTNSTGIVTIVYKYNGAVVTNPTTAGTYDVIISQAAAGNFTASEITTQMTIDKAKPSLTIINDTLSYNYGQTIDVSTNITVKDNFDNIDYVVTYNGVTTVPTIPGTYPVLVVLPGNNNQEETSTTFTLVINKVNATYEGTKTFNATYGDKLIDVIESSGLACAEDLLVGNAGTQTITVTYNPNSDVYNTINVEITVNVAKVKVTIPDNTLVEVEYSGTLYEFKPTGFDSSLMNITNNTETVVGNYTAVVSLKDAANYEWSDSTTTNKEYSFSIYAKKVTIPTFVDKVYTYNTNAQTVEINNLDLTVMTITGNTQTNAGTHKVTIALIDKANYVWADGSTADLINDFVIEKAKVQKPTEDSTDFVYDGNAKTYVLATNSLYTISSNTTQTDAGTYDIIVTLKDTINYVWTDGTSNELTYKFTIAKATPSYTLPTNLSGIKGNKLSTVELPGGWSWTNGEEVLSELGEMTFTATFIPSNTNNYNIVTDIELTVDVANGTISSENVSQFDQAIDYTASAYVPSITITMNGSTLNPNTDYKVTYKDSDDNIVTEMKNAGTYTVVIEGIGNYSGTVEIPVTINKAKVPMPVKDTTKYVYDGTPHTYQIATSELYTISDNLTFTQAGLWMVRINLVDKVNYEWIVTDGDNHSNELQYEFRIYYKNINDEDIIVEYTEQTYYTGSPIIVSPVIKYNGMTLVMSTPDSRNDYTLVYKDANGNEISADSIINVGTYTIEIWGDNNYAGTPVGSATRVPRTITFSILPAENAIKNLSINGWVYGQTANTPSATALFGTIVYTYGTSIDGTFSSTVPTNAGKYYVKAEVVGTTNYEGAVAYREFEITKATQTITVQNVTAVYDGNAHSITGATSSSGVTVTYSANNSLTNVGTVTVTLTAPATDNYAEATTTATITITKAPNSITNLEITGWAFGEYNETINSPKATTKFGTIVFTYSNTIDGTYTEELPTQIGTYYVKATVVGTDNYEGAEAGPIEFAIGKKTQTIEYQNIEVVYDGFAHSITGATSSSGVAVIYSTNNSLTNVGSVEVTITAPETDIYAEATVTATITITKAPNSITDFTITGWTYNETPNKPTATAKFGTIKFTYSITIDGDYTETVPTNAGTYYVKAVVEGTSNYDGATTNAISFVIAKATQTITVQDVNVVYDGNVHSITGATSSSGVTVTYSANNSLTNVGSVEVTLTAPATDNYAEATTTATITITKASNSITDLAISGWIYGQDPSTPTATAKFGTIKFTYSTTIDGNYTETVPTNAGTYYVKAVVEGTSNYDGATSEAVSFVIAKAENSISDFTIEGWTYGESSKSPTGTALYGTIVYTYASAINGEYTSTIPTNAGTYYVKAEVAEGENYKGTTIAAIEFTIAKATPTISNFSDITINIGESYEVNPVVTGINGENLDYSLTYKNGESALQTAPTDIGTYSVILLVNLDNYYVEKTITLQIKSNVTEFTVVMPNLEIEYDGNIKQLTYTGELPDGVTIKGYQYQYDYSSGILSTEGVTDAGSYKVTVQLEYDNTLFELTDDSNLVGMLTITPIKVTMISNIAKDYDSSNRTWALFSETLYELIKFYDVNGNEVAIPDNASGKNFTITGMHNGVYYYGTSVTGLVTTTNVAGSTYLVTVKIDNTNYQITGATTCILKYKTVSVGGTLYTIEDALLLGSGTITTLGNRTGAATYIETVFCNLTKAQKYPYSSYEYVLSGRTLLLPYKDGNTSYYTNLNTAITSTRNVYSALTIPSLVTLNVTNNGNLVVGAGIGSATDVRDHSVIMNNGEVNIDGGCNVYAYGYIKGNGNLNLKSGSNTVDCLRAYDWPGGSAASSINGKPVFPINAYSCHNISCYTYIYAGAIYKGYLTVSMNIPILGYKDYETTVIILGAEGTTNESLFNSVNSSGNDYILKYATPALTGASATALSTITGSNQVRGQRDVLEIHGEYTDNNLKVSVSGATMETSTTTATPIGYMHIKLCSGSDLMINSSDYVFLPGTSLIVEENATLTIGGGVDMSFVTWEELVNSTVSSSNTTLISTGDRYFGTYCVDKVDAFLQNNGTVTVSGNIGGIITTTVEGAILNLASGNVSSTYNSLYDVDSPYYYTGTSTARGITSGLTQTELTASPYISVKSGDTYYWSIADNVNSFNITFMDGDTVVKTIKVYSISDTSYQLTGTEYVHSKLHYDFVHWKTSDGVLAEDILLTVDNNSVTLYAVWEEHEYNFYYTAGYLDSFGVLSDISESADLVFANKITGFTISDFDDNNVLTITTSATYLEGHFNGWYLGLDDSSGIKISKITLEQLELFISEYGDAKPIPLYCQFTELDTFYVTITDTTLGINLGLTVEEGKTLESYKDQLVFDSSSFDSDESYQYYLNGFKDIEGNAYTLNELLSIPITEDKEISLNWSNKYSVTYKYENDTTKTVYIIPNNTLSLETLDSTKKDKKEYIELYTFAGWTLEGGSNVYTGVIKVEKDITLIPNYQLVKYRYKITITATDATVTINGTSCGSGDHYFDTSSADSRELKLTLSFSTTKDKVEVSGFVSYNGGEKTYSTEATITNNVVLTVNGAECLAEGTLITMADGTKKKVEDLVAGDMLIVFNHETGKYETAEVLFNDAESVNNYTVVNLEFSNGSVVRVIAEHGFFDLDLMKYVYIDEYNYMDYVGHRFVASTYVDGEVVQSVVTLDNAFLTEEYIRVYSPVTKYHMNYITEDILSMPGGIEGLFNIFEYDDNLQYNEEQMQKDIETYGLFTYEDFKDLVSYEVYCSFPAAYFKVALGKGILTWEDLEYYIARYAPLV